MSGFSRAVLALLTLCAGWTAVLRAADGDLDPTFGGDGKVTTGFEVPAVGATSLAVQVDGKIVVAGLLFDEQANVDFALARYDEFGALDPTFDLDGRVRTDFAGLDDVANAVALQPDGKIVAAGSARVGLDLHIALARYGVGGVLDLSFDGDGRLVMEGETGVANGLAIQPDGGILVTGSHFALVRFTPQGTLDTSFGQKGKVSAEGFEGTSLVIQPDGRIVVVGVMTGTGADFAVLRFNSDGSPDKSFGSGGLVTTDFLGSGDAARAVALQSDGKIVVAGSTTEASAAGSYIALARYEPDGSLDSSFDDDGRKTTDLSGFDEVAFAVAIDTDGRILAGGTAFTNESYDFVLVRYGSAGLEDPTFGTSGVVLTDFFGGNDRAQGIALQADGKVLAAGSSSNTTSIALARYLSTPTSTACPRPAGFWMSHPDEWPVSSLTLGSQTYSGGELGALLKRPIRGDASVRLAEQLIAAKFNLLAGLQSLDLAALVSSADAVLSGFVGKLPYNVSPASSAGREMLFLAGELASHNNRRSGSGCSSKGSRKR